MSITARSLRSTDWTRLRPMLAAMGVGDEPAGAQRDRFARHLEWQAHRERAAPFYERLGHRGDPCPQPDYPTFLLDLTAAGAPPAGQGR